MRCLLTWLLAVLIACGQQATHAATLAAQAGKLATEPLATLAPVSPAPSHAADDNTLLLEVVLDERTLSDTLAVIQQGDEFLVPMGELARLLTLAITVDARQGRASGFVVREDQEFGLDLQSAVAHVQGRQETVPRHLMRVEDGDVYVAASLLSRWWPVGLQVQMGRLQLEVTPRIALPLQSRLARERLFERAQGAPGAVGSADQTEQALVPEPHAWLRAPTIDQNLGTDARWGRAGSRCRSVYSAYITGDVAGMEAAGYLDVAPGMAQIRQRWTLSRHDPDGHLLGALQATSLKVGQEAPPIVPQVLQGGRMGTGLSLSNRPLDQPTSFDRHAIRGDLPPGWDVTLYYNDALAGYQPAGRQGQYVFEDLPLAYGPNEFRLVFNGPLGQVRVERQSFLLDQAVVKPGQLLYALSSHALERGLGQVSVGRVDVGITQGLSLHLGGVVQRGDAAGSSMHGVLGLRQYWQGLIASLDWVSSPQGGQLWSASVKTRLGKAALSLEHTQRNQAFESDMFRAGATSVLKRDKLQINQTFVGSALPPLSVSLEASHEVLMSGAHPWSLASRVSTVWAGTALSQSLRTTRQPGQSKATQGVLQLSRRAMDTGFTAQLEHGVLPRCTARSLTIMADRTLRDGYRGTLGLLHNRMDKSTLVSAGMSKRFEQVAVAVTGSYGSDRHVALGLQLFMSLSRDPRTGSWQAQSRPLAGSGSVSVRTFLDRNLNGVMDLGDEPVAQAGLVYNQGGRYPGRTDAHGLLKIDGLPAYLPLNLSVDSSTLEDPQWRAASEGVRVLPRPGVTQVIDVPVLDTAEIEGTISLLDAKGKAKPVADVRLEWVNESGRVLASTRSASDGYYLLHQVRPGKGRLRVAPEQAQALQLSGQLSRELQVPGNGHGLPEQNLLLERLEKSEPPHPVH
jgi:hypothetical protein